MKLGSLAAARPAYYDRNAVSVVQSYNAVVAPHTTTSRWAYTIASGKKALIEYGQQYTYRKTVATTSLEFQAYTLLTVGGTDYVFLARPVVDNTVAGGNNLQVTTQATIYAGEVLTAYTYDQCTGGTISFGITYKFTSYDV